jgi:hypothetical protein
VSALRNLKGSLKHLTFLSVPTSSQKERDHWEDIDIGGWKILK